MLKSKVASAHTSSKFVSVVLLSTVSAFAINCGSAMAQDTNTTSTTSASETVVVRGIANSLKSSQGIKKSADVIVDSITAEDIGALPDRSVTEALARVPGVSINRFAAGVDPDHFSVEGSGVTVRGLNLTRSEINGRDSFSANNGRGLSFADVPSELMAGVDVFKNPDASMIEGGISGAINLRTRLPLDSRKRIIAFSGEYSYGDFAKEGSPTYSALYSNSWDTGIGKLGFLVNVVNSQLTTRSDATQVSNYACRTNVVTNPGAVAVTSSAVDCNGAAAGGAGVYFPRGAAFRSQMTERERKGLGAAVQWRSNDDTMTAALQYLRSETDGAWTEYAVEVATDNVTSAGDSYPVFGSSVTFDDQGIFTSGIISSGQGWRSDQNTRGNNRTPQYGLQSNNIKRDQSQTYMTEDYSFNFKWTPNDRWGFKFDVQHVNSTVDIADNTIWGSSYQDVSIKTNGDDLPTIEFLNPTQRSPTGTACTPIPATGGVNGNMCSIYGAAGTDLGSPANSFWRSAMDHFEQSEGTEDAVRLDATYQFEDSNWLKSVDFGVRWSERDQTTRFSNYNWGRLSEIWGGGGPVWMDENIPSLGGSSAGLGRVENFGFNDFMRGKVVNPVNIVGRSFYAGNAVTDYEAYKAFALAIGDYWAPRYNGVCADGVTPAPQNWVPASMRCDVIPGTNYRRNEVNPVNEVNKAAYGVLRFKHDASNGWSYSGNIGLRYTQTERESSGFFAFPKANYQTDADCTAAEAAAAASNAIAIQNGGTATPFVPSVFCAMTPAKRQELRNFANGAINPINTGVDYDYLLPSLNLKIQPNSKVVLRLGLSKSVAPPEMGLTRAYYNVQVGTTVTDIVNGIPTGRSTVGNPKLKPTQSTNIDLSAEWYFAPVGSLTLAVFHKELTDVITNTTERLSFTNNGGTFDAIVTTPGNSPDKGTIKGYELAYQQTYDFLPGIWSGLGMNANYSYIDSDGVKQSTLSATDPDVSAGRTTLIDTSKLPLQGLSKHNANLSVFYEKYGLSARLAYNYRSDFLVTVRDVIVPFQPIMQEGTGQLDGSIFYDVTPNVKAGIQMVNLLNNITHTKAIIGEKANGELITAGRSWFMNDRRFNFIVRAKF